jgi:uridine kinase
MIMQFNINKILLAQARTALSRRDSLYWILGGAGSGKTTVSQALSAKMGIPVYDMDAHIYGTYHNRFTPERHPVNTAWSSAPDGLAWLLDLSWEEFNQFNQAAVPEYLDLL